MTTSKATQPPARLLTAYLLRKSIKDPIDALKSPAELEAVPLGDHAGIDGELFIKKPIQRTPAWVRFLQQGAPGLPVMKQGANSAVLLVKASGRMLAFTFGHGRHFLSSDAYEVDFGLKVTLNAVDPTKLRSLDLKTFEEQAVLTRRQTSRGSGIGSFGVDPVRDILGAVTGEPTDVAFAHRLTGRDALAFSSRVTFAGIAEKSTQLLKMYERDEYKTEFKWVDNIRAVRDEALVGELDGALAQLLSAKTLGKFALAPPDIVSWEKIEGFHYPSEKADKLHAELDLEECLEILDTAGKLPLDPKALRRSRIRVAYTDELQAYEQWSLYESLVGEIEHSGDLYAFVAGQWYRVEKSFAHGIVAKANQIPVSKLALPAAGKTEREDAYNARAAGALPGAVLMDQDLLRCEGATTQIEACDLFVAPASFVHVKRKTRSATLSHLFAQGAVSAEAFLSDMTFRKQLAKKLNPSLAPKEKLEPGARPDPGRYRIVFAIVTPKPGNLVEALPFFSALTLVRTAESLSGRLGYRVELLRIPEA